MPPRRSCRRSSTAAAAEGTQADARRELGPEGFARWMRDAEARAAHRHHHARRAPVAARHAHAHARHRRASRRLLRAPAAAAVLAGMLGRGDLRRRHALPDRGPVGAAGAAARARAEPAAADAAARRQRASATPTIPTTWCASSSAQAAAGRHRRVPHLRLRSTGSRTCASRSTRCCETGKLCEAAICYTGDILDPDARQVRPQVLRRAGQRARGRRRAHPRHQGHGGPAASRAPRRCWSRRCARRSACRSTSTPTTPRGIAARHRAGGGRGRRRRRRRRRSMRCRGLTSQPCLGSLVEALRHGAARHRASTPTAIRAASRSTGSGAPPVRRLRERPRAPAPPRSTCTRCRAASTPTSRSRRARSASRARWHEVAHAYAEVNQMFGDIVKVTPSSKVVGDMALMMVSAGPDAARGARPGHASRLPRVGGADDARRARPAAGRLPAGAAAEGAEGRGAAHASAPARCCRRPTSRPSASASQQKLPRAGRPTTDARLLPHVSRRCCSSTRGAARAVRRPVAILPTPVFFYGMEPGRGDQRRPRARQDADRALRRRSASRTRTARARVFFELNGQPRSVRVPDRSQVAKHRGAAQGRGRQRRATSARRCPA